MMAAASVLVSCEEKEENLGAPEITLDPATLEFGETGGADNAQTLTVTSTRDWTIEQDEKYDWVTVSPSEGAADSHCHSHGQHRFRQDCNNQIYSQ